jgi:EAL domain-containing protein (putative c-di-GMP-specific phosphodiesterase class I)
MARMCASCSMRRTKATTTALGRDAVAGHAVATAEPYSDKWGSFMTGWAPIRDASGRQIGVVGVDASVYLARMAAARNWALLGIAPAGLLIMVLCIAFWHLRLRGLVGARVRETLRVTELPAHCLQFEVTEREVMRDPAASLELMRELQAMGVHMAMDDFGTGTSSLACLRDYPFDTIKIDRSFVSDLALNPDVLAVIHATITLVENLGKAGVAEGVENESQVAILQSLGCRYAQGFFFSRPVPAEKLLGALELRAELPSQMSSGS